MRPDRTAGRDGNAFQTWRSCRTRSGVQPSLGMRFDNHFRRACQHHFGGRLQALAFDVGKRISATRRLEHVVHETDAGADVDVAERAGLAAEHERRARPRPARDPRAHRGDVPFNRGRDGAGFGRAPDPDAQFANRRRDVAQSGVTIVEQRNLRATEPRDQVFLAAVHDDEIGLERQDALEIRIDSAPTLGRVVASAGNRS